MGNCFFVISPRNICGVIRALLIELVTLGPTFVGEKEPKRKNAQVVRFQRCMMMIAVVCQTSKDVDIARRELAQIASKTSAVEEGDVQASLLKKCKELLEAK